MKINLRSMVLTSLFGLVGVFAINPSSGAGETTTPAKAATAPFTPPYPQRNDPFKQPDGQAALASRREAAVQQTNLKLKGFVNVGGLRAVVEIDGQTMALSPGERRGDIQVLEVSPPTLTLQRGRHRWTENLLAKPAAKPANS